MTSVRLRLLILALTPLIVLMPLLLVLGMSRWTADYDEVLIANVESELRIANQYLARLLAQTGNELDAVAGSVEFARVFEMSPADRAAFFAKIQDRLGLDFLRFLPLETAVDEGEDWPVIARAARGASGAEIDVFSNARLTILNDALAVRAQVPVIDTPAAVPTNRKVEDRGMVVHAASPVALNGRQGVLVGGMLLNPRLHRDDQRSGLFERGNRRRPAGDCDAVPR